MCIHPYFLPNSCPVPELSYAFSNSTISTSIHHGLEVYMSDDLSQTDDHNITSKAYQSLGVIRITFTSKRPLYLFLFGSQLSYCSPIWSPHLSRDIFKMEWIQRRATKYILGSYSTECKSPLIELNLLSLMYMYFYELTNIMYFVNSLVSPTGSFNISSYISFSDSSTISTITCKLNHAISQSTAHRHFYFNRLPNYETPFSRLIYTPHHTTSNCTFVKSSGTILSCILIPTTHVHSTIHAHAVNILSLNDQIFHWILVGLASTYSCQCTYHTNLLIQFIWFK